MKEWIICLMHYYFAVLMTHLRFLDRECDLGVLSDDPDLDSRPWRCSRDRDLLCRLL